MSTYSEKLKDPRWQKIRLEVLQRDNWKCRGCGDDKSTLHVHHGYYQYGLDPWEYPLTTLHTLCEACHASADNDRDVMRQAFAMLFPQPQHYLAAITARLAVMRRKHVRTAVERMWEHVLELSELQAAEEREELRQSKEE